MPHPDDMNSWVDGHPDEGLLHEWLDEQLSPEQAEHVAAHVANCALCQARVAEARGLVAASRRILSALDVVPAGVIPSLSSSTARASDKKLESPAAPEVAVPFRWRRWSRIAAALMIAVTGAVIVWNPVSRKADEVRMVSAPAAVDTRADAPAANAPVSPRVIAAPKSERVAAAAEADKSAEKRKANASSVLARDVAAPQSQVAPATATAERNTAPAAPPPPTRALTDAIDSLSLDRRLAMERQRRMIADTTVADSLRRTRLEPMQASRTISGVPGGAAGMSAPAFNLQGKVTVTASFDSLVLQRAPCVARCDGYEVRVESTGAVHLVNYTSNKETRSVQAQLSEEARRQLNVALADVVRDSVALWSQGRTVCTVVDSNNVPTLRLMVAKKPGVRALRESARCPASNGSILRLGTQIDSIVGTPQLIRRLPPQ